MASYFCMYYRVDVDGYTVITLCVVNNYFQNNVEYWLTYDVNHMPDVVVHVLLVVRESLTITTLKIIKPIVIIAQ